MQLHAEIRALPPGIAVAAQRKKINGDDVIVIALSDSSTGLPLPKRQTVLELLCQAVNSLLSVPESHGPVTIPLAS